MSRAVHESCAATASRSRGANGEFSTFECMREYRHDKEEARDAALSSIIRRRGGGGVCMPKRRKNHSVSCFEKTMRKGTFIWESLPDGVHYRRPLA